MHPGKESAERIAKLILGLALCAASLAAQIGPRSAARLDGKPDPVKADAPSLRAALASENLFLRLSELPGLDRARTLELAFDLDGERLASEQLQLQANKAGDVEILARRPELLARIYQAAAQADGRVRVSVRLDGRLVREQTFHDLVAANRRLKQAPLSLLRVPSQVTPAAAEPQAPIGASGGLSHLFAKDVTPDPGCVQDCNDTYGYCSSIEQVGCDCYPNCVSQCINNCPQICTEPASVSESTTDQVISYTQVDYHCYEDWPETDFWDGHYYWIFQTTHKRSRIRTTRHCDGSTTDEVIDVSYYTSYCSDRNYLATCEYPWSPTSYPPPSC